MKPRPSVRRRLLRKHGEDFLDGIEAIALTLEDGRSPSFSMQSELDVPQDPVSRVEAARTAPARLAFWSYQRQRARSALRSRQQAFDEAESDEYLRCRRYIEEHTQAEMPTERNIRAHMDHGGKLKTARERVAEAQSRYDALDALVVALEHRSHLLRALLKRDHEAPREG